MGVSLEVDRLRRERHELIGEVSAWMDGHPFALVVGDLNFSSVQARATRAKLLQARSGIETIDWYWLLERFVTAVMAAERHGAPAVVLADASPENLTPGEWLIDGFPLLRDQPMVIFGRGGTGKSYLALWLAGCLAKQVPVLYADWEFSVTEHRRRLARLFWPMPRQLYYVRCERSLREEQDRLKRLLAEHQCQYLMVDSIVFALEGNADDADQAALYFRLIRQLHVGTLHVAHTTKAEDDKEKQVFGSVFFSNGARAIWFVQSEPTAEGLRLTLHPRKATMRALGPPYVATLTFTATSTRIERVST